MANPSPQDIRNSVGAAAEICWIFFSDCTKRGFSRQESMSLTIAYLQTMITTSGSRPGTEEF